MTTATMIVTTMNTIINTDAPTIAPTTILVGVPACVITIISYKISGDKPVSHVGRIIIMNYFTMQVLFYLPLLPHRGDRQG